jgi:phage shock protein E
MLRLAIRIRSQHIRGTTMVKTLPELIATVAGTVRTVDAATALAECRDNGGIIVDVREADEVAVRSARGTTHIPRGVLEMQLPKLAPEHDRPIYLHCASGGRARLAVAQLEQMGYENVTAISCPVEDVVKVFGDG